VMHVETGKLLAGVACRNREASSRLIYLETGRLLAGVARRNREASSGCSM
jgi:hypothetical protein